MEKAMGALSRLCILFVALAIGWTAAGASYHEEVLDNGLRVILLPHRANPMVASSVVVVAGAVHEPEGMNGASHFLEHLLFNGTETRTQRQLYDEVDRYGAYNNATTREDHTLFTLLIQKEFAEKGLAIQADMLFHSILPPDKFEKEKGIVQEELARDKTDAAYLARRSFRSLAYAGTPLSRSVLGTEESIAAMKREEVLAYYRSRYVTSNMTLVVMGDFQVASMLDKVKKIFGAAPAGDPPPGPRGSWPQPPEKNLWRLPLEAGRTYLHAAFPLPLSPHDPLVPAVESLLGAVGEGKNAPLSQVLTSGAEPMVLSYSLGLSNRVAPWSSVEFEATLEPGRDVAHVLDQLRIQLMALAPGTPAWDRVSEVRASVRSDELLLADRIHYYALMRSSYLVNPPEGYLSRRVEALESIGGQEMERAAALLKESLGKVRVVVSGPGLERSRSSWKPGSGPSVSIPATAGTLRKTLGSGIQVAFERNDDSRVFALHLIFRPRSASEPEGKGGIADFLHRIFLRGSRFKDAATLDAGLASMGATLKAFDSPWVPYDDYYTSPRYSFVRLEMPVDRWREGLSLLGEITLHPRLREEEIEAVRAEMLDLQRRRAESVSGVARSLLVRTLAPGHPAARPVLGSPESVGSITLEDLRAFHGRYVTGKRMILTGTGPVAPEQVVKAIEGVYGELRPGDDPPDPPPLSAGSAASETTETLGKEQAYLALGYLFEAEPEDRGALQVAAALLSDRLSFRLREEKGLAYSMSATIEPFVNRMKLQVLMGTRPENLEEALSGLRRGLEEYRGAEIDEDSVVRARSALRGRMLMRRLTRVNLAYFSGMELLEGCEPGCVRQRLDGLLEVEAKDVMRVVRRYLKPERLAVVIVR